MERNFQPVIIFSFSKKECEAYALQMSKLDFNSGEIKPYILKSSLNKEKSSILGRKNIVG